MVAVVRSLRGLGRDIVIPGTVTGTGIEMGTFMGKDTGPGPAERPLGAVLTLIAPGGGGAGAASSDVNSGSTA